MGVRKLHVNHVPLIDIESLAKPVPYVGNLFAHPFVDVIEATLYALGFEDPALCRHMSHDRIVWSASFDNSIICRFQLFLNGFREVVVSLTCTIGQAVEDPVKREKLYGILLLKNRTSEAPWGFSLDMATFVMVNFECNAQWMTPDHLAFRTYSIPAHGAEFHALFLCAGLIQLLPASYFQIYA
jgi:hypothetical protein